MSAVCSFSDLRNQVCRFAKRFKIAVCQPSDEHTLQAVLQVVEMGFAHAILVGETAEGVLEHIPAELCDHIEHIPAEDDETAAQKAVQLVHDGEAQILMKGLVNSDVLLRHVLNKTYGLRTENAVISHIAVFETQELNRLLILSDVAVIPYPNLEQRIAQLNYTTAMARRIGINKPKVALLHCTEKISEKFPITTDYVLLKKRAEAGEWGEILIDGPLDLSCAISAEALTHKRIVSSTEGEADILIMPDIQAGNVLYKSIQLFARNSTSASLLCGTTNPVVLTSRGDTIETKVNSLALAALQV
ncbi:phosphate butyryltransferase [Alloprevotella sp. OH1205_COT-284]|uniref:phosphate acyltransferase n=1 Tax=Alloprevotella sp. OH1205_COT-284 TaxID=2491043 RepID=UPI000F5EFE5F|nr:phosphate acyltransferase [Alloprevotella sp. OH1205_COT-284]RRD78499.1 phosphate butyryltransferase [Alloprevotella sp. OH1205_COT-284]